MRKIVAGLFISLDGVVEAPETWHFPYFNDEMGEIVGSQIAESDTMLLGRRTYEEFAGFWPNQGPDVPMAAEINAAPKLVASTTLKSVGWQNSTLIKGNVAGELRRHKERPGKDIQITGSPTLVRSLIRDGVLDELRLLMHPIVVGHGKRLFDAGLVDTPLRLASSRELATGVVYLVYTPPPAPAADSNH
jgi:dihydrofolate reductase